MNGYLEKVAMMFLNNRPHTTSHHEVMDMWKRCVEDFVTLSIGSNPRLEPHDFFKACGYYL
jgi:hypothetical protein